MLAIDGTILEIPNTELLRQEYGSAKNQNSEVARAKAVCLYDVQNKLILKSKIDRYNVTELISFLTDISLTNEMSEEFL